MAQAVQGRTRRCARGPQKWAAKKTKDRCKCGQSTNLGALRSKIRFESYSRRIQQIVKEDLGMRKISSKMVPRIWTHDQTQRWLHISSDLLCNAEMFDMVITVEETWCSKFDPETKDKTCSGKHRIYLGRKGTHVSVADQDHFCVFNRSQ
jgi:hypothetical protein